MTSPVAAFHTDNAKLSDIARLVQLREILLTRGSGHYAALSQKDDLAWKSAYATWLQNHITQKGERVCIAVARSLDQSPVGCAIGIIDERAPMRGCLNGRVGWVQTVVVDTKHQRRGVARQTMEYLFHWFRERGAQKVALQTTTVARDLYTTLGFTASGEDLLIKLLSNSSEYR